MVNKDQRIVCKLAIYKFTLFSHHKRANNNCTQSQQISFGNQPHALISAVQLHLKCALSPLPPPQKYFPDLLLVPGRKNAPAMMGSNAKMPTIFLIQGIICT